MKWQPIETAPKEAWVLVYYDDGMGVSIAQKDGASGIWHDWDGDLYGPPTHWMKLPDHPES